MFQNRHATDLCLAPKILWSVPGKRRGSGVKEVNLSVYYPGEMGPNNLKQTSQYLHWLNTCCVLGIILWALYKLLSQFLTIGFWSVLIVWEGNWSAKRTGIITTVTKEERALNSRVLILSFTLGTNEVSHLVHNSPGALNSHHDEHNDSS